MTMPLSIFILVLFIILNFRVKGCKKGEFHEDFLSLTVSKNLLGFCAIGIMLHHLVQKVTEYGAINKGFVNIFNDVGVIFVGMFFFFSGYGLYISMLAKPGYFDHFFKKRFPTVLIPFYMVNIVFLLGMYIWGVRTSVLDSLLNISGLVLMNGQMWYIVEIIILYIAFYLLFRFVKNKQTAYILMAIFILLLIVGSLLLGHNQFDTCGDLWFMGEWWYNATFMFFIGITTAKYSSSIIKTIQKHYAVFLSCSIVLFILLFVANEFVLYTAGYYQGVKESFMTLGVQFPMLFSCNIMLLIISMKLQFKNEILSFLGKISLELYLIHNLFILTLRDLISNDFLYIIAVYAGAIILATGLHFLDSKMIRKIKG